MLRQLDVLGNPYVGVVLAVSDRFILHPPGLSRQLQDSLAATLGAQPRELPFDGTTILGAMFALNSRGVVGPHGASVEMLRRAVGDLPVGQLRGRFNAAGNNILVNDKAALVNPSIPPRDRATIADIFGVEVTEGTIADLKTVGSAAVATNKGVLCHPKATVEERAALSELFGVPAMIGTANYGSPMLGAAVVGNSHGAVTGTRSTGIELGRIEEALRLY